MTQFDGVAWKGWLFGLCHAMEKKKMEMKPCFGSVWDSL